MWGWKKGGRIVSEECVCFFGFDEKKSPAKKLVQRFLPNPEFTQ